MVKNNKELKGNAREIHTLLDAAYPGKLGFLTYASTYELLISVILSAQTTDRQVNLVTGELFSKFPEPNDLAGANTGEVEEIIRSTGYFRAKAKNIIGAARTITDQFNGKVPGTMKELLMLPGVGRKSANVILGAEFGQPAVIVDTHFGRVVRRLGLTSAKNPEKVEQDIRNLLDPAFLYRFSMTVNNHGRVVCHARKPECDNCLLRHICAKEGVIIS